MKGRKRSLLPLLFGAFLGSSSWIWLLRAAVSSTVATARGGTETSPHRAQHPHGGIIAPFRSGDPGISLDADALRVLASGHPYRTQVQSADSAGGRGMVVQDVRAPARVVWDRILDFEAYPKMVPKTIESQVYRREKLKDGSERIWVRMKIGFPPVLKLQFFVSHLHDPAKNSLTWTLDYSKQSDLDDSVGFWYVVPHPDDPENRSRVYYSVEVRMFPWVPAFVVDFMSRQALVDATAWVKKSSEKDATRLNPTLSVDEPGGPAVEGGGGRSSPAAASDSSMSVSTTRLFSPLAVQKRGWWGSGEHRRGVVTPTGPNPASSESASGQDPADPSSALVGDAIVVHHDKVAVTVDWLQKHRIVLVSAVITVLLYTAFFLLYQSLR